MTPGNNHFQSIRKAVEANALRFQKVEPEDENIPVLQAADSQSAENKESNSQDRIRVARVLREQRLRIKTLQSAHRESMVELQREHRLELQALRNEISELKQKYERLRVTNEQLKHRLARRNEQYLAMQEKLAPDEGGNDEQANASAETVLLREQLERKQRELELRDEKIQALEQENKELQHQDPPENSLLDHLRQQAVFLVAYHPGVGHITLPYDDIDAYFNNPVAYAADRCGMNEPAYREWLSHYEQPVCNHVDASGEACGEPIMRVTQPSEFRAGIDDRCDQHRPD